MQRELKNSKLFLALNTPELNLLFNYNPNFDIVDKICGFCLARFFMAFSKAGKYQVRS